MNTESRAGLPGEDSTAWLVDQARIADLEENRMYVILQSCHVWSGTPSQRRLAALLGLWLVSSGCTSSQEATDSTPALPNVIFIAFDQFRADLSGAYGGNPNLSTPHLDRMAEEGVVFANAVSPTPLCTPFRGMVQTARYPTHTGLVVTWLEMNPAERGIAHVFREAGYRTGFLGKWHLTASDKKTAGKHIFLEDDSEPVAQERLRQVRKNMADFRRDNPDAEFVPPGPQRMGYDHWEAYNFHSSFNDYFFYRDTPEKIRPEGFETDIIFDQAISFIESEQKEKRPFFLMLMPHPPHPPFELESVPPGYLEGVPETLQWSPNVPIDHPFRRDPLSARTYYAMAKNADDNMGRLLDFLDRSGLSENTIVAVTSDHGEMLGSHGRTAKLVPYAESVDVPVIMRWKGKIPSGRRVDTVHTPMDHFPTLCSLAGLPIPSDLDGRDLTSSIFDDPSMDQKGVLIANYTSHFAFFDSRTIWPEWRGVRTQRYTYVEWIDGRLELYDNPEDRYQQTNQIHNEEYADVRTELQQRLRQLLSDAHDEFAPGTAYADWFDDERNLIRTALGPIP